MREREREIPGKRKHKINNKMMKLNPNISIITVKVNGLNTSVKKHSLSDAFFSLKKGPAVC